MCLQLKFHDDAPYMLLTQSTFDELSRRLVERDVTEPVTLEHFRPTITISGNTSPFEEVFSFITLSCDLLLLGGELLAERCCTDDLVPSIFLLCLPPCDR